MDWFEEKAKKYGGIVIAGVIGAIIRRIRETMTLIQFIQVIAMSVFVSYCVGVVVEEHFKITENYKYVIGAISAVYSKELLDELSDTINGLSDIIKGFLNKKINND